MTPCFTIKVDNIPNTFFVPTGSDIINSYAGNYLYNETRGQYTTISGYDTEFHKVIATIPNTWLPTDRYNIRAQLPTIGNFSVGNVGNTVYTINLNGISITITPGDFLRVLSTGETAMITNYNTTTHLASIVPPLSQPLTSGAKIEVLIQTSDNYKTLSHNGTSVGQHEHVSYNINLVSGSLPNVPIKNGFGGYGFDYPFLYVEFCDTNQASNNLYSNNHSNKSYFKVTTKQERSEDKFIKFTGDSNVKTVRFKTTSNFRIVWRLPSGDEIKFTEQDTRSPQAPNPLLQTAVTFNIRRI